MGVSSFDLLRAGRPARGSAFACGENRGPKTALADDALLALLRADLATSPFTGEGPRRPHHHRDAQPALGHRRLGLALRPRRTLERRRPRLARLQNRRPLRRRGTALAHTLGGVPHAARGIELCHDPGSQYLTDYFQANAHCHGFVPSFALLGEPETNGGVERFHRPLKE